MFSFICLTLIFKWINISSSLASLDASPNPTSMIPPVTEGQVTNLTPTPDICPDGESSNLNCNLTGSNNTFNTASNKTVNDTDILNKTCLKTLEMTGETVVDEGETLNLTCTVKPASKITWSKLGLNKSLKNDSGLDYGTSTLIIDDVTTEDSGQYICATHQNNLTKEINVTVIHKKKLEITGEKTIEEGDTLRLICKGFPQSLLIWTKFDSNTSLINGTGTATLIIHNVTSKNSGLYMCTAQHQNTTLTENVDIKVKWIKTPTITGESTIRQNGSLNLTCTVDAFPSSIITWTKPGLNVTLKSEPGLETLTLLIHNVTEEHSGQYYCSAVYPKKKLVQNINITVIYQKRPKITGESTVTEGHDLNLTCSVDSWPLSFITWTKHGLRTALENGTGAARLIMSNVTVESSGLYICSAKHQNVTVTEEVYIKVNVLPKILEKSECNAYSDALTCWCISEGFPSPTITWEPFGNYTHYSVTTTVSNYTVNSTIFIKVINPMSVSAICVSRNKNGETKRNLTTSEVEEEGYFTNLLRTVTQMGKIIPFLIGLLLSAIVCCLLLLCCRKKKKSHGDISETLEMITQEANGDNTGDYEPIHVQGTAGRSESPEVVTSEIEYSDVNLLLGKQQNSEENADEKPNKSETEYAKIRQKGAGMKGDGEGQEEEEETLCATEAVENEAVPVYSNVKKLKDQI
ncbi:PREDICTED: basement membrane-specific heparan sulfate proteoglycan core protein-like [Cyprinodon variegatus]|uniref:Basement membrane-specific heparan sulfate proteoglycan core protein-like n=1 Tax=Cyprinodon variegatus TaxID=28743 RepID=A0A3Q2E9P3_CYPVA|nr:PREDICTED: basement membrane-specific heparan sulfate proteoglycan core protein-like [Cyprinodon variegatus]